MIIFCDKTVLYLRDCFFVPYDYHSKVCTDSTTGKDVMHKFGDDATEIAFPGSRFNDLKDNLTNPNYKIATFFVPGRGIKEVFDLPSGTNCLVIDDKIYKRITYTDLNRSNSRGLLARTSTRGTKRFSYFLLKISEDPFLIGKLNDIAFTSTLKEPKE